MDFEYIPFDNILEILSDLNMKQTISFFSSNKYLLSVSNDHRILRFLSEKHHLPYITSFSNLVFYSKMNKLVLFDHAIGVKDKRLVKYYKELISEYNYIGDAIEYGLINYIKYRIQYTSDKRAALNRYNNIIVFSNAYDILMYLSNDGEYLDSKNIKNLLIIACKYCNIDMVMKLTAYIDRVENKDGLLSKCLKSASTGGDIILVKYLVEDLGANITSDCIDESIRKGHADVTKYLIDKKQKLFTNKHKNLGLVSDSFSVTPNADMVLYLHSLGIKYDNKALKIAIESNNVELVKVLVEKIGLSIEEELFDLVDSEPMLEYFIDYTNNIERAIYIAFDKGYLGIIKKYYLENKIITSEDFELSIENGYYDIVRYLLENGGVATSVLLDQAVDKEKEDLKMVKLLVEYGAKVSRSDIITAKSRGYTNIYNYLKSTII